MLGVSKHNGSTESFFDGLEERLYDLFFERSLEREHYPEKSDEEFQKYAWDCYRGIASSIFRGMYYDSCNPYNLVNYRLEEWRDAIILADDPERGEFEKVIQFVDQPIEDPGQFTAEQIELARRVSDVLSDPTLPEAAKARIKELRARPCHPNCIDFYAPVEEDEDDDY